MYFFVNHAAIVLGHAYQRVDEAVRKQMDSGPEAGYKSELTVSSLRFSTGDPACKD